MRNTNKKGFTIVELVVVVAVIAILAAVLIPVFSGVIRQANIASDTAVAKNLNEAAIAAGAEDFDAAIAAVREAGYLIANLNAKADECYFVWEDDSNQFLLYDLKNSEIIYSNSKVEGDPDASWCFAISNSTIAARVTETLQNITVKNTAASVADLKDTISKGGEATIYIDESIVMDTSNVIEITDANAKITIDLGTAVVAGNNNATKSIENIPFRVTEGELTLKGGNIQSTGDAYDADGEVMNNVVNVANGTLKLESSKIEAPGSTIAIALVDGAVANINNSTIIAHDNVIQPSNGSKVTIHNTSIECAWLAVYSSSLGGSASEVTITGENGKYHATTSNLLGVYGGKIFVEDGEFNCDSKDKTFKFYDVTGGQIVLKGGTFNGIDFENLDEATLRGWCNLSECTKGVTIIKNDGAWYLTVN